MKDFIVSILDRLIGYRHLKKVIVNDHLEIEFSNILSDNKWHHIGVTATAWIRRTGKNKFRVDDVAVFLDGKKREDILAIYKFSKNNVKKSS